MARETLTVLLALKDQIEGTFDLRDNWAIYLSHDDFQRAACHIKASPSVLNSNIAIFSDEIFIGKLHLRNARAWAGRR